MRSHFLFTAIFLLCLIAINTTATAAPFAYVISSAGINVIDQDTNTVVATVPVGSNPSRVSISPDGSRAYVTNSGSNNVSVINTATNTVVATVPVGTTPQSVSISPDGSRAYVTNSGSNNVSVINTATNTVTATVGVSSSPSGVSISPDGSTAYVARQGADNFSQGFLEVIRTSDNSVVSTITVGNGPAAVAVSPDGNYAYVTNVGDGALDNMVSVINTSTNAVVASTFVGADPWSLTFTPDSAYAYISNASSGSVSIMRTSDHTIIGTISGLGFYPGGITTSPDGRYVYLARYGLGTDAILKIDTNTNTVVGTITPTGVSTHSIAGQFSGYPLSVYVAAGASIAALLDAGFTTAQLLAAGVTQAQLDAAGVGVPGLGYWGMAILLTLLCGYWLRQRAEAMKRLVNSKGFTLVEILIVLGIIGALAAILAPTLTRHIGDSSTRKAEADVKNIAGAIGKMSADTGHWPVWQSGTATKSTDNKFLLLGSSDGTEPDKASGITDWVTVDETIGDQLVDNAVSYPTTGRRAWKGPYLREDKADPWGNKYLVNAKFLHPGRVTGAKPVFVLSAGPNKLVETAFAQTGPSITIGGDDIVLRLK